MVKEERRFRKSMILLAMGIMIVFTIGIILNLVSNDLIWVFYPSLLAGMLFGVGTCIYLASAWDPKLLAMKKKEDGSKKSISWVWGPPLGVLVGNIIASFLGNGFRNMLMGVLLGWFYLSLTYIIIQVWRHRPK
ncbi:MAG: hypothetical protein CL608_04040 [Anaerolineaceae bacterium]|nr:hypothetical protein [Anaerolineaceae bacterium]